MNHRLFLGIKRTIDLVVAGVFFVAFLPVFALIAVLVSFFIGSPVIYSQERGGLKNKVFKILKFRTMTDARNDKGELLPDIKRLTKFGKILRASSLDEMPELINIIRGDMSLVGPRPLLAEYLPLYSEEQLRRHEMRPGLTGWAQVNGRNMLAWEDRFRFDVWYVDNWSLALDFRILIKTLIKVLTLEGISGDGHATMPKFAGSKEI